MQDKKPINDINKQRHAESQSDPFGACFGILRVVLKITKSMSFSFYILKEKSEISRRCLPDFVVQAGAPRNDNPLEFLELPLNIKKDADIPPE